MGLSLALGRGSPAAPLSPFAIRRREHGLSLVRLCLGSAGILALYFDPALAGPYVLFARLLLLLYLGYGIATLHPVLSTNTRIPLLGVEAADIAWAALIVFFTSGPNSPLVVLYSIPVIAAAFRWGLRESFGAALASMTLFFAEAAFALSDSGQRLDLMRGRFHAVEFSLETITILLLGAVLGHLADGEKRVRGEAFAIRKILERVGPEADARESVEGVLAEIVNWFGAGRVVLVMRDSQASKALLWRGAPHASGQCAFHFSEPSDAEMARYLFPMPGRSWRLQKLPRAERYQLLALDGEGRTIEHVSCALPSDLFSEEPFSVMLAATFALGREWTGRVFLFDLKNASKLDADLRFFQELVREAAPAVHGVYLLQHSRSRARATERARVARDLHDGVIQSLIALEMRVDELRRAAVGVSPDAVEKLENVREYLREEVVGLRELTEQLRMDDVAPSHLAAYLAESVMKFQRETGICATFVDRSEAKAFSPRVSREVAKIVHEALTNVRKHSGARSVSVTLESGGGGSRLVVEDDGKGFAFSGRRMEADLDAACFGPRVIRERVHAIKGELLVDSRQGRGARLEIRFTPKGYG